MTEIRKGMAEVLSFASAVDCATVKRLVDDYVDGEIDSVQRLRIERHLSSCEECSRLVFETRNIVDVARSLADEQIPEEVSVRLRRLLRERLGYTRGSGSPTGRRD